MENEEMNAKEMEAKKAKLELATAMAVKVLQEWLKTEKGVEFTEEQTAEFRKRYEATFMMSMIML